MDSSDHQKHQFMTQQILKKDSPLKGAFSGKFAPVT